MRGIHSNWRFSINWTHLYLVMELSLLSSPSFAKKGDTTFCEDVWEPLVVTQHGEVAMALKKPTHENLDPSDLINEYPRRLQHYYKLKMENSEGRAKVFSAVEELIEQWRNNPSSSLWPKKLSRSQRVSLSDYFSAIKGDTHYARTLRSFWNGSRQFIEMDVSAKSPPDSQDILDFASRLESSVIFEAAAVNHGLTNIELLGDDPGLPGLSILPLPK